MNAETVVKIVRAFKPGDVVFIECEHPLRAEHRAMLIEKLQRATAETGIKFFVLDAGMKLAAREETIVEPPAADS